MKKLLIANRGEIAIRISRTARTMGIATVGIYTADDASSLHLQHMDEAHLLPLGGVAGYLDIPAIVALAVQSGCDAVHPGYGLLSERAAFSQACLDHGIAFVGPSPKTLAMLGDKAEARTLAKQAGVAIIQGSAPLEDADAAHAAFDALRGQPMMLKAVNGGGGRGMRVVHDAGDIDAAFDQCRSEALTAFGDGTLYAERFLTSVRHIEVQIVGDGVSVTHLWERDCSIQRRNQKVIEVAPAPALPSEVRDALLTAAIRIGRATGYRGLGTVEFLVDSAAHDGAGVYFIETNPRIQVEHTITEEITGLDLVELQLRIAAGEPLAALGLDNVPQPMGHAVQLRINTETYDPTGEVSASSGTLTAFAPPSGPGVRVDTAGYRGYRTNPHFDSLLAKLVVHDRSGELARLWRKAATALSEFHVTGPETNIGVLSGLLARPELGDWAVNVRSLEDLLQGLDLSGDAPKRFLDVANDPVGSTAKAVDVPEGMAALRAPMQASVHAVWAQEGAEIAKGQVVAVIEAMKMQHEVKAPTSGMVVSVPVNQGDVVDADCVLIVYAPNDASDQEEAAQAPPDPDHIREDLARVQHRIAKTLDESRPKAVQRRRDRGQRTTRENISALCEGGDFHEYGQLLLAAQRRKLGLDTLLDVSPADGIVTGVGEVNADSFHAERSQVAIMAYDSTVMAGTQGFLGHKKTDRMMEVARQQGLASIFLTEGGGGRPNDDDFAYIVQSGLNVTTFSAYARLEGWGPKLVVNSGYCFAGNAALFGTGDIRIATRNSWIGLAGPAMIEAGGLGAYHPTEIGPAEMHAKTGLVDILAEDDAEAMQLARQVLSYFQGDLPDWDVADQRHLRHAIPENRKRSYLIRPVIDALADTGTFIELGAHTAPGLISGFLRIEGRPMGVIANNPQHLGGALDAPASAKGARFLALCSQFGMPVLSLCDTPGFMVGPESETQGAVAAAAQFIGTGARMQAPIFFVCLRKGYGIGAQAMAGGSLEDPVFSISWPTGEFGAMGLEGGVRLGYRKEMEAEPNEEARKALFDRLVAEAYDRGQAINIASLNEIDAVIDPADTRSWIAMAMRRHAQV